MKIATIDTESNGFLPMADTLWVVSCKVMGRPTVSFRDKESFVAWYENEQPDVISFHNGLTHDLGVLRKVWGVPFTVGRQDTFLGHDVCIVDTFLWSMLSYPDREGGHSVEEFGNKLGFPKMDYRKELIQLGVIPYNAPDGAEFKQFHPLMVDYCERDALIGEKIFEYLVNESDIEWFKEDWWIAAKRRMFLLGNQAEGGVCFDTDKATILLERINIMTSGIENEVEPQLPLRPLNKGETDSWRLPARPFLKSGEWSSAMLKWMERTGAERIDNSTIRLQENEYAVVGSQPTITTGPMRLANQSDLKDYLLREGWEPTLFNVQKDARGKPVKDDRGRQVNTSPKFHERGKLCPNLELMEGELIKQVIRWLSLRNRRSVVEGWLANPRLEYDGRLTAGGSGLTPTMRVKHVSVANVPKAKDDVLLGHEMRDLFCAPKGRVLVGWDASGLEDRIKAHWTYKYDGGEYANKILDPNYDVHQEAADLWGIPRHTSKNGVYALAYRCGVAKLAQTIKCSMADAKRYHEAYWELNSALVALEDKLALHWETWGNKKRIRGLDGRPIHTRSRHSLVNSLIQSTGAILFDYSLLWLDKQLGTVYHDSKNGPHYLFKGSIVKRVIEYHDEVVFECDKEVAEELAALGAESVRWAGRYFKLNVALESEGTVGHSWKDLK